MVMFDQYVLGVSESEQELEGIEAVGGAALALAGQAGQTLEIFTRDLDPRLYDTPEFADACARLACNGRRARIRILLMDENPVVRHGHRLVELSRRLSSFIHIRLVHEDYRHCTHAYLVADGRGYCYREQGDRYQAVINFNDVLRARELVDEFNEVWEHSQPSAELRRLHL